jgi:rhomboid protease GluP
MIENKTAYMNALTHELVSNENFMPVKDKKGEYALYNYRHVLQLKQGNNVRIVEVLDGDKMTLEEIERHCLKNIQWIVKASSSGVPKMIDVFVFNSYPDVLTQEVINRFSGVDYCLLITDIKSKQAVCINQSFGDNLYLAAVKKAYEKNDSDFMDLKLTFDVIKAYNNEILNEMLPNKNRATYIIMGITILIYFLDYIVKSISGQEIIKNFGVKQSALITMGQYWRLFTPILLHADFMHIGSNMLSLYILGQTVEKFYGSGKFVAIYVLGGIMGNIFSYTLTKNLSLGASGAVFAIGGAVVVIWKMKASRLLRMSGRDLFLVILIGMNIVLGFSNTGIDNWAHLGGLAGGILMAYALGYRNDIIKKEHKIFAFLIFVFLAVIVYSIGYDKWSGLLSHLI